MSKLKRFLALQDKGPILKLQTKAFVRRMGNPKLSFFNPGWLGYRRRLRKLPVYPAPYDVGVYKQLLLRLQQAEVKLGRLSDSQDEQGFVVLRHDLDYAKCVENVSLLTKIEATLNLRSSLMVRVDNRDYDPKIAREIVTRHHDEGFEVGVHSTAYMLDGPFQGLLDEFQFFEKIFGIKPQVYNFHGGFDQHLAARIKLGLMSDEILTSYPDILETDSISGFYAYRFSDCMKKNGSRVIGADFEDPPVEAIKRSEVPVLLLTHPCYWAESNHLGDN